MDIEQQQKANSNRKRKRKQKHKEVEPDDASSAVGINKLPDDVLVDFLSRLISRNEAVRTSVLSHRWRYLWKFCSSGTLELDDKGIFSILGSDDRDDLAKRITTLRRKFIDRVNRVLKLHQGLSLDGLIIRFGHVRSRRAGRPPGYIDDWIYFAMQKKVKIFELDFSISDWLLHACYDFPNVDKLLSHDAEFGFGYLRSLRFVGVDIEDKVVHYFLAKCPYLEQLSIRDSETTRSIRVVDPLVNLKVLEICDCNLIKSIDVSSINLVSCTYEGRNIDLLIKETPNLSDLTLGGAFPCSFIHEPNKHSSYSVQLVKLTLSTPDSFFFVDCSDVRGRTGPRDFPLLCSLKHLELNVWSPIDRSTNMITSLIMGAPLLNELKIKICHLKYPWNLGYDNIEVSPEQEQYCHENLKAVKMTEYVGHPSDDMFVLQLLKIAPSLETVTIDTESEYYDNEPWVKCIRAKCKGGKKKECICTSQGIGARTRIEAKQRAELLKFRFPPNTVLIV
ncbi:hypothetical protein CASFOL_025077 [Castilleja foliolosa]|uniref:At1g61320/AtMIF1 LRR domain-containing protein n=1 Tax=Castilleja foliolosa TaxID=1961234 RepID=A0ABD3CQ36_9LAMI